MKKDFERMIKEEIDNEWYGKVEMICKWYLQQGEITEKHVAKIVNALASALDEIGESSNFKFDIIDDMYKRACKNKEFAELNERNEEMLERIKEMKKAMFEMMKEGKENLRKMNEIDKEYFYNFDCMGLSNDCGQFDFDEVAEK